MPDYGEHSLTPLLWSIGRQDLTAVSLLLSHNPDSDQRDSNREPLFLLRLNSFTHDHSFVPPPFQRSVLQKVLDKKPAWCETSSAIRDLKLCKCVSVAYCSKECQRADWKKHKPVCASTVNKAILTEEKAAFAREGQKKKKAKARSNEKVSGKKK